MPEPDRPSEPGIDQDGSGLPLKRLVLAEIHDTLRTKSWWVLALGGAVLVVLVNAAAAQASYLLAGVTSWSVTGFTLGLFGTKSAMVHGVIRATRKHPHLPIYIAHRATSARMRLLAARLMVAAAIGAISGLVCVLAAQLLWHLVGGTRRGLDSVLVAMSATTMLICALWAVLGIGLGMLLDNRIVAIVVALQYLLLVEPVISLIGPWTGSGFALPIGDYLPGGSATATLTSLARELSPGPGSTSSPMPWWLTLLLFVSYVALALVAGVVASRQRGAIGGAQRRYRTS